jgi:putative (di)nucleoside polyphosphate hydrolase
LNTTPADDTAEEPACPPDLDRYRPNVGVVLISRSGRLWQGRRAGTPGPHNWQFPQGGVDAGETLHCAALRELHEETGASAVRLLGRTDEWIAYTFPAGYQRGKAVDGWIGQRQIWFALRFEGEDADFDLGGHSPPEFDAWRWATPEQALAEVAPFKRATYAHVLHAFARHIAPAGAGAV